MDIRDPTLIDIRLQPLGSSRDKPGKERGRALYTKPIAAQAAAVPWDRGTWKVGAPASLCRIAAGAQFWALA